ncbi:MAG: RtcB family protein, partial [Acidobacteria bacterium]|nr:RtcB family protein [Acidobacteriota bacterium]
MHPGKLERRSDTEWVMPPVGRMRVPGVIYGTEDLIRTMDEKVAEQLGNLATLPGIEKAAYAMPDAHWGYGFPIGGVAAFDPERGGVVSAGGVGFDISCGVRCLTTGLTASDVELVKTPLADTLFKRIPAGVGSSGKIRLSHREMDDMLSGGAAWAVEQGYGTAADLARIEERGSIRDARPDAVSSQAKDRQKTEMGTLGSGNHYLEVQRVAKVYDTTAAERFGAREGEVVISIHCGSRGLGHQVGTDYLREMAASAAQAGIDLPDRELACAP